MGTYLPLLQLVSGHVFAIAAVVWHCWMLGTYLPLLQLVYGHVFANAAVVWFCWVLDAAAATLAAE